ncbi:MAG TPA: rhomboid family intramembrane serine protease [Rhizomicrobium sp.]|nr:rhomboid family intramembrane serine protease [Rhizomicrobium sp.]
MAAFGKRGIAGPAAFRPAAQAVAPAAATASRAADFYQSPSIQSSASFGIPGVTIFLLLLLAAIYALEVRYAPFNSSGQGMNARVLASYGGISRQLALGYGEWWRFFTAPLLHANFLHLLSNSVVLGFIGYRLEPMIGSRWFAALFVIGGIGGGLGSTSMNEADIVAVGASGAIMGLLGAAFMCGFQQSSGDIGSKMQILSARVALPALIPMPSGSGHIDYSAHLGGALAGLAMGMVLQAVWADGDLRPRPSNLAGGIGIAGLVVALFAFVLAMFSHTADLPRTPGMIPQAEVNLDATAEQASALLARYPHDPRSHFIRGLAYGRVFDLADAEAQFRAAMPGADPHAILMTDRFNTSVTLLLALTVSFERRPDEARALARPLCATAAGDAAFAKIYASLKKRQACD